jgi:hypothetical protein
VLALVRIVRAVRDAIVCYDQPIETLTQEHPDFAIIDSLPGVADDPLETERGRSNHSA